MRYNPSNADGASYLLLHRATTIARRMLASDAYSQYYAPKTIVSMAFATANTNLEHEGLRVPGSNQLTQKGAEKERYLLSEMSADEIENAYYELVQYTN